jgi:hypothetical protein
LDNHFGGWEICALLSELVRKIVNRYDDIVVVMMLPPAAAVEAVVTDFVAKRFGRFHICEWQRVCVIDY